MSTQTSPRTRGSGFTIERTFKAGPEAVWRMWTTPEGIARWWVLSARDMGYAMTVRAMDVRVGGKFAFALVGNGHQLVNGGTYRVVDAPRKLAWTWHFDIFLAPGEKPYDVPISVELERTPTGGTRMVFTQGPLATPEHTEGSRNGVLGNFEKLSAALGEDARDLILKRTFSAPPERVWAMWTNPAKFREWWGPEGATAPVSRIDLRVGGRYAHAMRLPDGEEIWTVGRYIEVVPHERLTFTESAGRPDGSTVGDLENQILLTFEKVGAGTKMTFRLTGMPAGEIKDLMGEIWPQAFEKIERALKQGA